MEEELGKEPGIKNKPSPVVRNDDREVLAQGLGVELVEVRRDLVHERELGRLGVPVGFFRFHFVDRIAAYVACPKPRELLLEGFELPGGLVNGRAVGGEGEVWLVCDELVCRFEKGVDALAEPIVPFTVEPGA